MSELQAARALLYALAGSLLALAYFSALAWNVRSYVSGSGGWGSALVLAMRLLGVAAGFGLIARRGPMPLLSGLVGFHLARSAVISRQRRVLEKAS
jgi:F1F0 ATPase subunit 2